MEKDKLRESARQHRVEIRDRNNRNKLNALRAQFTNTSQFSQQRLLKLKAQITEQNLTQSLPTLKQICFTKQHLSLFLHLSDPLLALAASTSQLYVFNDCITVLINMSVIKNYKPTTNLVVSLAPLIMDPTKQKSLHWYFGNLLNCRNDELLKEFLKMRLIEHFTERVTWNFEDEEAIQDFNGLVAGVFLHADLLADDQIRALVKCIQLIHQRQMPECDYYFTVVVSALDIPVGDKLSLTIELILPLMQQIFASKKSNMVTNLLYFFETLSYHPNAYPKIFKQHKLTRFFKPILTGYNPNLKLILLTILSNLASCKQITTTEACLEAYNMIKQFQTQKDPVKLGLARLMAESIYREDDPSHYNLFKTFGLYQHIRNLLSSQDPQMIRSALHLVGIIRQRYPLELRLLQQLGIPQMISGLLHHPQHQVSAEAHQLLDLYFS